ncbi:hypothetical protein B0H14DRAFT_2358751 [Mycena olivaceomarginata]|nr:hypothetical protein B0H14DRAFT_2358751 [Mycena olivaceomarginata]
MLAGVPPRQTNLPRRRQPERHPSLSAPQTTTRAILAAGISCLKSRIPGLQLHVGWVPGHVDFEPNERVDKEAKSAAQNEDPLTRASFTSFIPRSAAAAKAAFQARTSMVRIPALREIQLPGQFGHRPHDP